MFNRSSTLSKIINFMIVLTFIWPAICNSADMDRAGVEKALANAVPGKPADLRRKDLKAVDLSGLDFTHADLWGSDLRGANLSNSNLSGLARISHEKGGQVL